VFHDGVIVEHRPMGRRQDGDLCRAGEPQLGALFHRLNNELGIIIANAELLESKATDPQGRTRAGQVIGSALDAMSTAKQIRSLLNDARCATSGLAVSPSY
jgi:hypothetical protein